jgi:hypothetical protein
VGCNAVRVVVLNGLPEAPNGEIHLIYLVACVALTQRVPHPRVLGPQGGSPLVIIHRVERHLEELVRLTQPIPCPKVLGVEIHCPPVGLNGRVHVLELHVFVAHERPSSQAARVELQGTSEVLDRLVMLPLEGVVVPHHAARLGAETVGLCGTVRELRECREVLLHKQDVGKDLNALDPKGISAQDVLVQSVGLVVVLEVVLGLSHEGLHEDRAGEDVGEALKAR